MYHRFSDGSKHLDLFFKAETLAYYPIEIHECCISLPGVRKVYFFTSLLIFTFLRCIKIQLPTYLIQQNHCTVL